MEHASSGEIPPYDGYRVLVADDNAINCQIAKHLLEKLGCLVDLAASGEETLERHARQPYDLILMDCQMPDLDGYLACASLRATEQSGRHTLIIGWTANADQEEIEKCSAAGMDDCLSKHLRLDGLAQMLGTWLAPRASKPVSLHPSDLNGLEVMHRISGDGFTELAALFEEDMPQRIAKLRGAMQSGDHPETARIAHMMSGCCASIGAMHLSDLCQSVESSAKSWQSEQWQSQLAEIESAYEQIRSSLPAMLRSTASSE
jgi:CheY-like chemotaxis protein/HPt (histidine-containing phosphotransfer) domain-containing protein